MAQMFQILTQTNAAITIAYAQARYATCHPPHNTRDPPNGLPYGWNTDNPEECEQQNARAGAHGGNRYGLEVVDLCLIPDVGVLTNFKTPKFDKYKGVSAPKFTWLCIVDNLTRVGLNWYVSLERGHIKMWRVLVEAFLKQYKCNEDMAPDRSRLQNMVKKNKRASKNTPRGGVSWQLKSSTKREMVTMFIDTLPSMYYDRIVENVASNFTDVVVVGDKIELGIRRRKFAQTSNSLGFARKPVLEKKKVEPIFRQMKTNAPTYLTRI
ncbi:hypothetical protein CR513_33523, partial [Mucuna pruriens]